MKNFLLLASTLLILSNVFGQKTGDFTGFVYDQTGNGLYGAVVKLGDKSTGTDEQGFFSFAQMPAGSYTLVISHFAYSEISKEVKVEAGRKSNMVFNMKERTRDIEGVVVHEVSSPIGSTTEVAASTIKIDPQFMSRIPTSGVGRELMQTLFVLPGMNVSGDQGGQLYIRGGPPIQNKVLMDGAIIFNPFHSIGFFSVFDGDLIKTADVYTGGFGAQFGGRISSIMDITMRDGNKKRFAGQVGISPYNARVILEGPFKKMKDADDGGSSASFLLSARGSYLEQSSRIFYPYARDTNGLPFNFWDIYGKVSLNTGKQGSKINFFGFTHNDNVNYSDITSLNWRSVGGGMNFFVVPGAANVRIDGTVAYSNYQIRMTENNDLSLERYSQVNAFNFGLNFHQYLGTNRITYGMEAITTATDLRYDNPYAVRVSNQENTTELAVFVRGQFRRWGFVFDPSMRVHYYASLGEASVEPRLGIKYNLRNWWRLKFAGGLYSQNLVAANSDRDVVNLFYGFLTGEEDIVSTFRGDNVNSKLAKSQHLIFGMEFDITKFIDFNIEGYYMNFSQLLNVNRNLQLNPNDPGPDYLKKEIIVESGYAAGFDATAKFEWKNLYVWLVYSFMKTERTDELITYAPHFDRRHNFNVVAHYAFGKDKQWEASIRWNLGSGYPFTQTQGFYEFLDFQDGISTDYTTNNGQLGIVYADINGGRLPWYHRLDFNFKRRFIFKKNTTEGKVDSNMKLDINIGATNIYNRNNVFYLDRVTYKRIDQLPIMYNVGINFEF